MTLVVARCDAGRIAIAADTLASLSNVALPIKEGVLKSCCLPGYLCVSYSGSPDLAAKAFLAFERSYPAGTSLDNAVRFFEKSSSSTGNDYILAFGAPPTLVTIREGRRVQSAANTHWIGDKLAFERFREYEGRQRDRYQHRRAVNAAIFADEMHGSPASNLHGAMRNIVLDREISTVGGFVTVLSNRDVGFRYSAYSDVLLDWPEDLHDGKSLEYADKFDLATSGENNRYSVSQISPGYYNMNCVAFYLLKGKLLIVFLGCLGGFPGQCVAISNVEPPRIGEALSERFGFDFRAIAIVMSAREGLGPPARVRNPDHGLALSLFCEANISPRS